MRSDDIITENPKLASASMIDVCSPFSPEAQTQNSSNSFDVASYSKILQQVAKLYPYEHTAITASLSLSSPSSSSYMPLFGPTSPFKDLCTFPPALQQKNDTYMALSYNGSYTMKDDMSIEELTKTNGEKALDLSTQRDDSIPSPYRRITLNQVKHKVVEDVWVENDKKLMWKDSKIAAFNPAQKLFMCLDCEHIGFLSRVAEHWLGSHANLRVFHCPRCPYTSAWSRCVKMHLTRHHNEQSADTTMWKGNPLLIEVTGLMQELRNKVESKIDANSLIADKRFYCPHCPYATDRRDLYTRHENIHKDDKPFHCYVCFKQFNRADHVKKHFVRMHADSEYDLTKIRKSLTTKGDASTNNCEGQKISLISSACKQSSSNLNSSKFYAAETKLGVVQSTPSVQTDTKELQMPSCDGAESDRFNSSVVGMDTSENSNKVRRKGEKAFTCHYCNWSGSDNWCLKRHMNTHIKPFACVLCDYKAARAERLSTHVFKVHNKKICNKCSFLADTQGTLLEHTREEHHNNPYSRRHICSSCGMSFDTKANLETHSHLSHTRPASPDDIVEITSVSIPDRYQGQENCGSFSYPENDSANNWSSNDCIKDANLIRSRGSCLPCCPHCEYQLNQHKSSKDHWLEHHEDVCGACVNVYTSVYGPQVWKKVVVHSEGTENQTDAATSTQNKRCFNDIPYKSDSGEYNLILKNSSNTLLQREQITVVDRSSKRPRKQSFPKKIITMPANHHSYKIENKQPSRNKFVLRCKLCPTKPKFHSIAQFKLHKLKRHTQWLKQSAQFRKRIKSKAKY